MTRNIKQMQPQIFGFMAGSLDVSEDIMNPIDEKWDAAPEELSNAKPKKPTLSLNDL